MRVKIELDTLTDIKDFVDICNKHEHPVFLTDGENFTVSAKSVLGAMYTLEWSDIYCTSEEDLTYELRDFIV